MWLAQIDEQFTRACGSLDYHLAARLVYTVSSVTPSSRGAGSYRKDTAGRHQYVALRRRQDSDEEQPWSPSSPPAAASEPTTTPQPAAAPPPRAPAPANEALGSGPVSQKETAPSPANEALRSGAASQKERRLPDANKVFLLSLGPFLPYVRAHSSHISPLNSFSEGVQSVGVAEAAGTSSVATTEEMAGQMYFTPVQPPVQPPVPDLVEITQETDDVSRNRRARVETWGSGGSTTEPGRPNSGGSTTECGGGKSRGSITNSFTAWRTPCEASETIAGGSELQETTETPGRFARETRVRFARETQGGLRRDERSGKGGVLRDERSRRDERVGFGSTPSVCSLGGSKTAIRQCSQPTPSSPIAKASAMRVKLTIPIPVPKAPTEKLLRPIPVRKAATSEVSLSIPIPVPKAAAEKLPIPIPVPKAATSAAATLKAAAPKAAASEAASEAAASQPATPKARETATPKMRVLRRMLKEYREVKNNVCSRAIKEVQAATPSQRTGAGGHAPLGVSAKGETPKARQTMDLPEADPSQAGASLADHPLPEASLPDASSADASLPDASLPDAAPANASKADHRSPDASETDSEADASEALAARSQRKRPPPEPAPVETPATTAAAISKVAASATAVAGAAVAASETDSEADASEALAARSQRKRPPPEPATKRAAPSKSAPPSGSRPRGRPPKPPNAEKPPSGGAGKICLTLKPPPGRPPRSHVRDSAECTDVAYGKSVTRASPATESSLVSSRGPPPGRLPRNSVWDPVGYRYVPLDGDSGVAERSPVESPATSAAAISKVAASAAAVAAAAVAAAQQKSRLAKPLAEGSVAGLGEVGGGGKGGNKPLSEEALAHTRHQLEEEIRMVSGEPPAACGAQLSRGAPAVAPLKKRKKVTWLWAERVELTAPIAPAPKTFVGTAPHTVPHTRTLTNRADRGGDTGDTCPLLSTELCAGAPSVGGVTGGEHATGESKVPAAAPAAAPAAGTYSIPICPIRDTRDLFHVSPDEAFETWVAGTLPGHRSITPPDHTLFEPLITPLITPLVAPLVTPLVTPPVTPLTTPLITPLVTPLITPLTTFLITFLITI